LLLPYARPFFFYFLKKDERKELFLLFLEGVESIFLSWLSAGTDEEFSVIRSGSFSSKTLIKKNLLRKYLMA